MKPVRKIAAGSTLTFGLLLASFSLPGTAQAGPLDSIDECIAAGGIPVPDPDDILEIIDCILDGGDPGDGGGDDGGPGDVDPGDGGGDDGGDPGDGGGDDGGGDDGGPGDVDPGDGGGDDGGDPGDGGGDDGGGDDGGPGEVDPGNGGGNNGGGDGNSDGGGSDNGGSNPGTGLPSPQGATGGQSANTGSTVDPLFAGGNVSPQSATVAPPVSAAPQADAVLPNTGAPSTLPLYTGLAMAIVGGALLARPQRSRHRA